MKICSIRYAIQSCISERNQLPFFMEKCNPLRFLFCIVLFSTFFSTCLSALTDKFWTGSTSTNWRTASNWSGGVLPTAVSRVKIGTANFMPEIIGYDRWGTAGEVWVGYQPGDNATVIINNFAGLNISGGDLYIGGSSSGYVYLRDGFIWCRNCYVNWGGWGQLEINSGGVTCETINVAGRINLYGFAGYIDTNDLQFSGPNKAIELKGGRIIWRGDHQAAVQSFINQGLIYCAGGTVLYDYNFTTLNATTVYATTKTISSPISLSNASNQIIRGKYIRNFNGHGISLSNCTNITIEDCEIGPCKDSGVNTNGGSNITVTGCKFRNCVDAVWFWEGGNNMKVLDCWILNAMKRAYIYSHGVAMCRCNGTGLEIRNNRIQNQGSYASMTDNINTYQSNGTAASPILIENNWIKNWNQMEWGGCGITTVDAGGSYNEVRFNKLVNPQYGGISISGGSNCNIHDNTIFGDDKWNLNGGAGIVVWDYENTGTCGNHTVINNTISFVGHYQGQVFTQCTWNDPGLSCGIPAGWYQNPCSSTLKPDSFLPGNIFYQCEDRPLTDMSNDCVVNENDLNLFAGQWLSSGASAADFYSDGSVNLLDFSVLVQEWLSCGFFPATACP